MSPERAMQLLIAVQCAIQDLNHWRTRTYRPGRDLVERVRMYGTRHKFSDQEISAFLQMPLADVARAVDPKVRITAADPEE